MLRRDQRHLQFGVEPGRAVVVPDSPGLRDLLGQLDGVHPREAVLATCSDRERAVEALDSLIGAGVVVDADLLRSTPAPSELSHLLGATTPRRAHERVRSRSDSAVALSAASAFGITQVVAIGELLVGAGVGRIVADADVGAQVAERTSAAGWQHTLPPGDTVPDAAVVVGSPATGPDAEAYGVAGVPHLALSLIDGIAVVGPFVRPGITACTGCVDATLSARDAAWPALVDQLRPANRATSKTDLAQPRSRVLEGAVAAWAAREVLAHLAAAPVLTYGASLRLDDGLVDQVVHRWALHPGCGCSLLS